MTPTPTPTHPETCGVRYVLQISILESYGMIMEEQVDAHQGEVTCLSSSAEVDSAMMGLMPTSRFLVSGGADNFIKIWGLEFTWVEDEENYNVELVLVQKVSCENKSMKKQREVA